MEEFERNERNPKENKGERVLGEHLTPKTSVFKPNFPPNMNGNMGFIIGFEFGSKLGSKLSKTSKNGSDIYQFAGGTWVHFLKFDGRIVIMILVLNCNSEIRGPFLTFSKSVQQLIFQHFPHFPLLFPYGLLHIWSLNSPKSEIREGNRSTNSLKSINTLNSQVRSINSLPKLIFT